MVADVPDDLKAQRLFPLASAQARQDASIGDCPTDRRFMTASGHYLATAARIKMLESGGNAADTGTAMGLAQGH